MWRGSRAAQPLTEVVLTWMADTEILRLAGDILIVLDPKTPGLFDEFFGVIYADAWAGRDLCFGNAYSIFDPDPFAGQCFAVHGPVDPQGDTQFTRTGG